MTEGPKGTAPLPAQTTAFSLFARIALAAAYLSACADRFGLWGQPGTPGVDWGDMSNFTIATAALAPYLPQPLFSVTAWVVTLLEIVLAISLITGVQLRLASLVSAVLLAIFAVSMAVFLGPKFPLNYSVLTASACSLLLYGQVRTYGTTA